MKFEMFDHVRDALADTAQEAPSLRARFALRHEIRKVVKGWDLPRDDAAERLGLTGQWLDDLLGGRLTEFSLDALVDIAARANLSVELKVKGAA